MAKTQKEFEYYTVGMKLCRWHLFMQSGNIIAINWILGSATYSLETEWLKKMTRLIAERAYSQQIDKTYWNHIVTVSNV